MESLTIINKRLETRYGRDVAENLPKFRVVWSEDETEKRHGTYNKISPSGLYLGTETGTVEIKKYWYLAPCWVLEKLERIPDRKTHDEVQASYTYEPIMVFLTKDDQLLPLRWRPIELAIQSWLNAEKGVQKTEEDFRQEQEAQLKKEEQAVMDSFDASEVADALSYGEGIVVPSTYQGDKDATNN